VIDEIRRAHLKRIASLGGSVKSPAKADAARKNARKAARNGGLSRSAAKAEAARRNGARHVARLKSVAEIVAEEAAKFKKLHPEWFAGDLS
jgi:hypothetical protein